MRGARVELGNVVAHTDSQGYFRVDLPPVADDDGQSMPLKVSAAGLPPWRQDLRLTNSISHRIIDLGAGAPGPDDRFDARQLASPIDDSAAARAPVFPIPTSIRVGYADAGFTTPCCVGSCSAVSVMSLETYVKRGLNDEWIASWTGDSLRAGAIAYRSYGAWHVANPRTPSYDICSSACCQVNDPDTSASSDAAVNATAGILLSQNGEIFRSEYSAENNAWDDPGDGLPCSNGDLSCGNGFVGSPATGWPCLADTVALGRGCFGHGRGMSQWGSQRWALDQGQRWPWIVNHYYNANGNGAGLRNSELTSPLRIDQFSAPASASPGQLITLTLELSNLAALAHDPVYIGASLFRSGSGFVSDPPRDLGVRLEPGSQQRSRQFQLPPGLSPGVWDVLVALYLDIDGNGAINTGDLALTSARQNGVLTIVEGPLFTDGFE
ncbi:MAG: SpoIID/LytB domain-containing protein [Lysobacterales bacterium]